MNRFRGWIPCQRGSGVQHKYRETLLFFPSQGQTCHSYCTFCFWWAQLIEDKNLRISTREFFARYDPAATWLDQLRPAFGAEKFFFEE